MNIPRDKRFYEWGEWVEILADKDLSEQPKDIFSRFVKESCEDGYRREYYMALEFMNETGPDWEDLTEEQRESIREKQREHAQAMHNFGKAIASGDSEELEAAGKKLIE